MVRNGLILYTAVPQRKLSYTQKNLKIFYFSHRLIIDGTVKTSKIPAVPSALKKPIGQVAPSCSSFKAYFLLQEKFI